jgi:DnaK suppressor protein
MSVENAVRSSGLRSEQVALLREKLEAERRGLIQRLASRRERLAAPFLREPDDADWASESADQALLARLVDRDAKLLAEVNRALGKLADGGYGVCELSGEPIGFERLRVRPWARYALGAKELVERRRAQSGEEAPEPIGDDRAA